MKLFKKILCSFLLVTALLTSVQTTAHAAIDTSDEPMPVSSNIAPPHGPITFHHSESGTVVVNSGQHRIYNLDGSFFNLYYPGESFYYDSVYTADSLYYVYYLASYVSHSGDRRLVPTSFITKSTGVKEYMPGLTIY